jgi:hypothetical protein
MPRSNFQEFTDDNAAPTSPDHCETEALGCLGALPPLSKRSRCSNGRNGAQSGGIRRLSTPHFIEINSDTKSSTL